MSEINEHCTNCGGAPYQCECILHGRQFKSSLPPNHPLNATKHTITITVTKAGDNISVDADFSDDLTITDSLLAINGFIDFVISKSDAKAQANGYPSALEAPDEFMKPLTLNDILKQWEV